MVDSFSPMKVETERIEETMIDMSKSLEHVPRTSCLVVLVMINVEVSDLNTVNCFFILQRTLILRYKYSILEFKEICIRVTKKCKDCAHFLI